jgi:hypothetical protein
MWAHGGPESTKESFATTPYALVRVSRCITARQRAVLLCRLARRISSGCICIERLRRHHSAVAFHIARSECRQRLTRKRPASASIAPSQQLQRYAVFCMTRELHSWEKKRCCGQASSTAHQWHESGGLKERRRQCRLRLQRR